MINVGFIGEILFRGFLFKTIEKESVKKAIIISTLTFGIGHIVNLFNGQDTLNTIIQIIYALSLEYLFVMIFYKSNSLVQCIITHSLINSLSIIETHNDIVVVALILTIISTLYAVYLKRQKN